LAYLKRCYPLEFFTAVINNGGGFYTRQTYVNEVRRLGFRVLPPDVNSSEPGYTAEQGRALRVGLSQLRDLPQEFLLRLLEDRQRRGAFADFQDFLARLAPGLPEIRVLIRSGALDGLAGGLTRPELFWLYFRETGRRGTKPGVRPDTKHPVLPFTPQPPRAIGDYPPGVKLRDELDTLGLMISRHPLGLFRGRLARALRGRGLPPLIDSRQLAAHQGRRVSLAGLLVTGKEVLTRTREPMIFVSFEDEHSVFETVFFPKAFREFYPLIDGGGVFLVCGRVEHELGALSVHVQRVLGLERPREAPSPLASGHLWAGYLSDPAHAFGAAFEAT
jgi:error-prone DNA polymerase